MKRQRQKGKKCKVKGCYHWCVSNDLCAKHNMALHRYGNPLGKVPIKKVCKNVKCRKKFRNKIERTEYCCPACYKSTPEYKKKRSDALKKYRKGQK